MAAGCDETVEGLVCWLRDLHLEHKLHAAHDWCHKNGAISIEEIFWQDDTLTDFLDSLHLLPLERQRFERVASLGSNHEDSFVRMQVQIMAAKEVNKLSKADLDSIFHGTSTLARVLASGDAAESSQSTSACLASSHPKERAVSSDNSPDSKHKQSEDLFRLVVDARASTFPLMRTRSKSSSEGLPDELMNKLPTSVSPDVLEHAFKLASQYARVGVENDVDGQTLLLGTPSAIMRLGCCLDGHNAFRLPHSASGSVSILDPDGMEVVRRYMNHEGMIVIDGHTGQPCANEFVLPPASHNESAAQHHGPRLDSRADLAKWVAKRADIVVINICDHSKIAYTQEEMTIYVGSSSGSILRTHVVQDRRSVRTLDEAEMTLAQQRVVRVGKTETSSKSDFDQQSQLTVIENLKKEMVVLRGRLGISLDAPLTHLTEQAEDHQRLQREEKCSKQDISCWPFDPCCLRRSSFPWIGWRRGLIPGRPLERAEKSRKEGIMLPCRQHLGIVTDLPRISDPGESALPFCHWKSSPSKTSEISRTFSCPEPQKHPFEDELPEGRVSKVVYRACMRLALNYASGKTHGQVLVLGCPAELCRSEMGSTRQINAFRLPNRIDVKTSAGREVVKRYMNHDGMIIIDGLNGKPCANEFFVKGTSRNVSVGGARTAAAMWVAERAVAIVIQISEDSQGEVSVLLGGGLDCKVKGPTKFGGT